MKKCLKPDLIVALYLMIMLYMPNLNNLSNFQFNRLALLEAAIVIEGREKFKK